MVAAGFSATEADQLRLAMATFKFPVGVNKFRDKLIKGMIDNGYDNEFAERTFKKLEGFGSYGFPESHAASFALIAYTSSWIKCHHPVVFCCAILNAQPIGFYDPSQLVRDAKQHGVVVRPIDVNTSNWDCTLEPLDDGRRAVRLGLRMARGLAEKDGQSGRASGHQPYTNVLQLTRRAEMHPGSLVCPPNPMLFIPWRSAVAKPPGPSNPCGSTRFPCLPRPTGVSRASSLRSGKWPSLCRP
jgi:error-prone DNA polymerase